MDIQAGAEESNVGIWCVTKLVALLGTSCSTPPGLSLLKENLQDTPEGFTRAGDGGGE